LYQIAVTGVNHRSASLEVREKLSFTDSQLRQALHYLHHRLQEVVLLFTCNRMEIYTVSEDASGAQETLVEFLSHHRKIAPSEVRKLLFHYTGEDAVQHLFKVVCGLDSMVLGETQVLGQVKEVYRKACEEGTVGKVFHTLFQHSFKTGKRVHGETGINDHAASVSYVAVKLSQDLFGSLKGRSVMVLGAGKMSELALQHLKEQGAKRVLVANRSRERACQLAERFDGSVINFKEMPGGFKDADIVITSTGAPHYVVHPHAVEAAMHDRNGRDLLFIDIALPRDVEPAAAELDGVHLYDLDDLQQVVRANEQERRQEALRAESILKDERKQFMESLQVLKAEPVISALRQKGESIYQQEKDQALSRLSRLSSREKKVVETMGRRVMDQLLKDPVLTLKELSRQGDGEEATETLCRLFNLDVRQKEDL